VEVPKVEMASAPSLKRNPYFSETQWDRLKLYLWYLREEMSLGRWRLELGHNTPAEEAEGNTEALGYVVPIDGRYIAWIYLAANFPEEDPFKQRHILVHELTHLYTRDVLTTIDLGFHQPLGPSYNSVWEILKDQMELQVDELARTMAPLFRLPDLNKPLGKKARRRLKEISS
jgi:hypothetical protein